MNSSQQEVKAEFIEGVQVCRECRSRQSLGDSDRKGGSLVFVWGLGFLLRQWSGMCVLSGIQMSFISQLFFGARGHGIKMFSASGLEYTYDGFIWSFSLGPSLDVVCSRETTNSLSLTRRTYTVYTMRLVPFSFPISKL